MCLCSINMYAYNCLLPSWIKCQTKNLVTLQSCLQPPAFWSIRFQHCTVCNCRNCCHGNRDINPDMENCLRGCSTSSGQPPSKENAFTLMSPFPTQHTTISLPPRRFQFSRHKMAAAPYQLSMQRLIHHAHRALVLFPDPMPPAHHELLQQSGFQRAHIW